MNKGSSVRHESVGVVLLNWNGAGLTIACIESLLRGDLVPDRIVVVDNASSDGSAELIEARFNQVRMIRNPKNLGFAAGNNVAIDELIKQDVDYIWVLNNDTEVAPACLAELVAAMGQDPEATGCCGKILYDSPRDQIWYAGATINRLLVQSRHRGALETDCGQYDTLETTPFITGCCMFVRKSAWQSVGGFDDSFFAYSEDLDWSLRARKKGMKLLYVPAAVIFHKISVSFRKTGNANGGYTTPLMIKLGHRNRLFIIRKHADSVLQKIACLLTFSCWSLYYSCGLLLLGRYGKLKSLWAGISEGMQS